MMCQASKSKLMKILRLYNDCSGCEVKSNENTRVIQCFFQVVKSKVMKILRLYNVFSGCEVTSDENHEVIQCFFRLWSQQWWKSEGYTMFLQVVKSHVMNILRLYNVFQVVKSTVMKIRRLYNVCFRLWSQT